MMSLYPQRPSEKAEMSEQIQQHIIQYLAKGYKISWYPPGECKYFEEDHNAQRRMGTSLDDV